MWGSAEGAAIRALATAAALLSGVVASAQKLDPAALADILTGDAAGPASENPQCNLFTPEEIAGFLGEPVGAGANAGMGMGCQWLAADDAGDAMVTVVPADYAEHPTLAPGFKPAPGIAADAFVVPELGGWAAGATAGDSFVKVSVTGDAAGETQALDLLRETLARRGG